MISLKDKKAQEISSIGIIGIKHGIGVTHTALLLANYLHSRLGYRVIFIELTNTSKILGYVNKKGCEMLGAAAYKYEGVYYIPSCTAEEAKRILQFANCPVVLDIDELNDQTEAILQLCKKRMVIGSMKPWCKETEVILIKRLLKKGFDIKKMDFFAIEPNKIEKNEFYREIQCTLGSLPYIPNPYKIKENDTKLIKQILE